MRNARNRRLGQPSTGTRRPWLSTTTVLAAGILTLAACGGDSGDDESDVTTAETVRIAVSTFGNEQLDPPEEGGATYNQILLLMYDTWLEIGPDSEIAPGLVTDWGVSDDGLTWTFDIRGGVQFHDGWGEVTAEDLVFSLERWMSPDNASNEGPVLAEKIDSITAVDKDTVEIKTKGVQVDIPYYVAPHQAGSGVVFSKKYLTEEGGSDFKSQSDAMNEKPIGSGPFKFVSRDRGQKLVYEAVADHWRATPAMKRVEFLMVPELTTQIAMLKSGEADVIEVAPDFIADVESAGFEVRATPDAGQIGLYIPGVYRPVAANKPMAKADVRHALSKAIDRAAILDQLLGGQGSLPTTPWGTLPSSDGIDEAHFADWAQDIGTYDPEGAKELLTGAGYPDGFEGMNLFVYARPGLANPTQMGEILAAQWDEVGITAKLENVDYATFRPHFLRPQPNDPYNAADPQIHPNVPKFDALNSLTTSFTTYSGTALVQDPRVDEFVAQAAGSIDVEDRTAAVSKAYDVALPVWTVIPMFNTNTLYAVDPEAVGAWHTFPGWAFFGRMLETVE